MKNLLAIFFIFLGTFLILAAASKVPDDQFNFAMTAVIAGLMSYTVGVLLAFEGR